MRRSTFETTNSSGVWRFAVMIVVPGCLLCMALAGSDRISPAFPSSRSALDSFPPDPTRVPEPEPPKPLQAYARLELPLSGLLIRYRPADGFRVVTAPASGTAGSIDPGSHRDTGRAKQHLRANAAETGYPSGAGGTLGAPGGSNGQIQFDSNGNFGGATNFIYNASTGAVMLQPSPNTDAVSLTLAPSIGTPAQDIFDVFKDPAMTTKAFWVDASGNLNFAGNNATYGSSGQSTASHLNLFGGGSPNAGAYLTGTDSTGGHGTYLYFDPTAAGTASLETGVLSGAATPNNRICTPGNGLCSNVSSSTSVLNNAANVGTTGMTLDMSASTVPNAVKLPASAGYAATADGAIGTNTATHQTNVGVNGVSIDLCLPGDLTSTCFRENWSNANSPTYGQLGWGKNQIGSNITGASVSTGSLPDNTFLSLVTDATSGHGLECVTNYIGNLVGYAPWVSRFRFQQPSASTDQSHGEILRVGFGPTTAGSEYSAGFGLCLDTTLSDTAWNFCTFDGTHRSASSSGVSLDNNFHTLHISSSIAGEITFSLDGGATTCFTAAASGGCTGAATVVHSAHLPSASQELALAAFNIAESSNAVHVNLGRVFAEIFGMASQ